MFEHCPVFMSFGTPVFVLAATHSGYACTIVNAVVDRSHKTGDKREKNII